MINDYIEEMRDLKIKPKKKQLTQLRDLLRTGDYKAEYWKSFVTEVSNILFTNEQAEL